MKKIVSGISSEDAFVSVLTGELFTLSLVSSAFLLSFSMDEKDGYLRLVTTVDQYSQADKSDYWQEYLGRTIIKAN